MATARELIAQLMAAESNINDQIAKLNAFSQQNNKIITEIKEALDGSTQQSAINMLQSLDQAQSEITQTLSMLEESKHKLAGLRGRL